MDNLNKNMDISQNLLVDGSNDWEYKKLKSLELSEVFKRLDMKNKSLRIENCGSYLEFRRYKDSNDFKLNHANFCKARLCPMCAWRRSKKIFGQVSKIMETVLKDKTQRFVFLTLTQKNTTGEKLSAELDNLFSAWNKLTKRKEFKNAVNGWFRALEITHNTDVLSKDYDTYHPHFHVILMVNNSYFNDVKVYIPQKKMIKLWRECLNIDYDPNIDMRAFKTTKKNLPMSIAETAKYTVKDDDFLISNDEALTDRAVTYLDSAMASRRLIAFGGQLKVIHKMLNLDDAENGDLVNTDNDDPVNDELNYVIEKYSWHVGYKQYLKS